MKKGICFTIILATFISFISCGNQSSKDEEIARLQDSILSLQNQQNVIEVTEDTQQPVQIEKMEEVETESKPIETSSSITTKTANEPTIADFAGSYKFSDDKGAEYSLKINKDGTVTLDSPSHTYYGSAKYWSYDGGYVDFNFGATDPPYIYFKGGRQTIFLCVMDANKEYLYKGITDFNAKNPNFRVRLY